MCFVFALQVLTAGDDDVFLADVNGLQPGVLTLKGVQRQCIMTMLFLCAGSLFTIHLNWQHGEVMMVRVQVQMLAFCI
jgi:hypothetical protein